MATGAHRTVRASVQPNTYGTERGRAHAVSVGPPRWFVMASLIVTAALLSVAAAMQ